VEPFSTWRKRHHGSKGIVVVDRPPAVSPADRARWLAELSEALDQALVLVTSYALTAEVQTEAFELDLRIEAARLEIHSLRLSRSLNPRGNSNPEWTELPHWKKGNCDEG